jgi:hypothetical protein
MHYRPRPLADRVRKVSLQEDEESRFTDSTKTLVGLVNLPARLE